MKYLFIFLFICFAASSEEKEWRVEKIGQLTVVSMNGEVQHGDTLLFWMKKLDGKCDVLKHTFTFYTAVNNPNINNLRDKLLPIKIKGEAFNNGKIYAEVEYLSPFLMGHRLSLSLGQYKIDEHIDYLSKYKEYNVTIVDAFKSSRNYKNVIQDFKAKDYFDIQNNSWKLTGIKKAILKGQKLCMQ
jgi:hypothetical protein